MARITKEFLRVGNRLIHYRVAGRGPCVVMLHDSPRSSRLYATILPELGRHFRVFALDTPGYGLSSPIDIPRPEIVDFADVLSDTLAALSLQGAPLYARHTSAKIALEYAARTPTPPSSLILDGLSIQSSVADDAFIESYMRSLPIDDAGAFLSAEWLRIRDMMRWFPWFDRRAETHTRTPFPSMEWFEPYVLDALMASPHYADAYAAAMRYEAGPTLRRLKGNTIVAARSDDVLYASLDRVPDDCGPHLRSERLEPDDARWLSWLIERFGEAATDDATGTRPASLRAEDLIYANHARGQMLFHRAGPAEGQPLLLLDAPTDLGAHALAAALSDRHRLLLPELPGYGESDALNDGSLADFADALATALASLGEMRVDVFAGGLAAPLALALASRHAAMIDRLIVDGMPAIPDSADTATADRLFPEFAIELSGAHWHRMWHYLRDSQCHWPWYDQRVGAQRRTDPVLDGASLYRGLLGMMKQPCRYGDVARAGLRVEPSIGVCTRQTLIFDFPGDPAYACAAELAARLPNADVMMRPGDLDGVATLVSRFLRQ